VQKRARVKARERDRDREKERERETAHLLFYAATHYTALQHTATHSIYCAALYYTATHYTTLQHSVWNLETELTIERETAHTDT